MHHHSIIPIFLEQNSYTRQGIDQFCPPSCSDDLCLLFCINHCYSAVTGAGRAMTRWTGLLYLKHLSVIVIYLQGLAELWRGGLGPRLPPAHQVCGGHQERPPHGRGLSLPQHIHPHRREYGMQYTVHMKINNSKSAVFSEVFHSQNFQYRYFLFQL